MFVAFFSLPTTHLVYDSRHAIFILISTKQTTTLMSCVLCSDVHDNAAHRIFNIYFTTQLILSTTTLLSVLFSQN